MDDEIFGSDRKVVLGYISSDIFFLVQQADLFVNEIKQLKLIRKWFQKILILVSWIHFWIAEAF